MLDTVFLHRENAVIRSFFDWQTTGSMVPYAFVQSDMAALETIVARHEGEESARLAGHWLKQYPQNVTVWRDAKGSPLGFVVSLPLHAMGAEEDRLDPAVKSTRAYLANHAPLRGEDIATLFRFWMAEETYQGISPIQSLIFIQAAKHYLITPHLAFTFFPCADPVFWEAILSYAEAQALP